MLTLHDFRFSDELSDEEIFDLMKIIYPRLSKSDNETPHIREIQRDYRNHVTMITVAAKWSYTDDDGKEVTYIDNDEYELEDSISCFNFGLSYDDLLLINKKLLALGVHPLLKDNPFI